MRSGIYLPPRAEPFRITKIHTSVVMVAGTIATILYGLSQSTQSQLALAIPATAAWNAVFLAVRWFISRVEKMTRAARVWNEMDEAERFYTLQGLPRKKPARPGSTEHERYFHHLSDRTKRALMNQFAGK